MKIAWNKLLQLMDHLDPAGLLSIIIDVAILVAVIVVIKGVFVEIVIHAISVTPPILQYLIRWNGDGNRKTAATTIREDVSAYDKKFQKLSLKTEMLSRKCRTETSGK